MVARTLVRVITAILALGLLTTASATAANAPPDASFGVFPREPVSGQIIRFVSYACDPDGSLVDQAWDLDNDGSFDDGLRREVFTSFPAGSHTVRLRATDNDGAAVVRTRTVDVTPGIAEYAVLPPFSAPLLSPFPVVRLAGRLTERGARIRLLSVRAPVCSTVTTRCRGRTCPFRRKTKFAGRKLTRIRAIQGRTLSAGVRFEVLIRKRDRIGKYTRFRLRRARPPVRVDRCLRFGDTRGTPCPSDL